MTPSIRSRIAPTPSGYLHLGNLANFLLIEKLVAESAGTLLLRIDDCDGTRSRPEFVEDIFSTLHWLGIRWQSGPRDGADFSRNFSQSARKDYYFGRLGPLSPLTYACSCSRREVEGVYRGACRDKGLAFVPGRHALRLRIGEPALAARFGDVVVWRKDGGPAYQWASVIDDLDAKVNLIVRGEDLRETTELQKHIAALVAPEGFAGVRFVHHPLLTDAEGKKLSKSRKATSVLALRNGGATPAEVREKLAFAIRSWGF